MSAKCPIDGNNGFPVIINGEIGNQDTLNSIKYDTKIRYAVPPTSVNRSLTKTTGFIDEPTNGNMIYYGSTAYTLKSCQLARTPTTLKQSPLQVGGANMQLYLTYGKNISNAIGEDLMIVCIPIIKQQSTTQSQYNITVDKYFKELISPTANTVTSFSSLFNTQNSCIEYITCIEIKKTATSTDSSTIIARCINLPGHVISDLTQYNIQKYFQFTIPTFRFSQSAFSYGSIANTIATSGTSYTISAWSTEGYSYTGSISVGVDSYRSHFIYNTLALVPYKVDSVAGGDSGAKKTSQYKCMPIDTLKDIKKGRVLFDPVSGKSLEEELNEDDVEKEANLAVASEAATVDITPVTNILLKGLFYFSVTAGVALGVYLMVLLYKKLNKPGSSSEYTSGATGTAKVTYPPKEAVAASASAAATAVIASKIIENKNNEDEKRNSTLTVKHKNTSNSVTAAVNSKPEAASVQPAVNSKPEEPSLSK